jgi:hypothetical protein
MISSQTIVQTGKLLVPVSNLIITRAGTEAILTPASGAHSFAHFDIAPSKTRVHQLKNYLSNHPQFPLSSRQVLHEKETYRRQLEDVQNS